MGYVLVLLQRGRFRVQLKLEGKRFVTLLIILEYEVGRPVPSTTRLLSSITWKIMSGSMLSAL